MNRVRTILLDLAADLAAGFGLLTRLPVGWLVRWGQPYRPGRAVWCYPLAGAVVGGACGLIETGAVRLGFAPALAAGWALCAGMLLTGGLHEDGLADLADGCGGGRTPAARLEIMRDSRIGAFGALALVGSALIRFDALEGLAVLPAGASVAVLASAGALSRMAMLPVLKLPPARPDGLGRSLGAPSRLVLAGMVLAAAIVTACALPSWIVPGAIALALSVGWCMARFANARLDGRTGDVLGACVVAADCVLLTAATILPLR